MLEGDRSSTQGGLERSAWSAWPYLGFLEGGAMGVVEGGCVPLLCMTGGSGVLPQDVFCKLSLNGAFWSTFEVKYVHSKWANFGRNLVRRNHLWTFFLVGLIVSRFQQSEQASPNSMPFYVHQDIQEKSVFLMSGCTNLLQLLTHLGKKASENYRLLFSNLSKKGVRSNLIYYLLRYQRTLYRQNYI